MRASLALAAAAALLTSGSGCSFARRRQLRGNGGGIDNGTLRLPPGHPFVTSNVTWAQLRR
eukprot:COSAG01_NODE_42737_length_437_cov_0.704142_1_plen_60_part_10